MCSLIFKRDPLRWVSLKNDRDHLWWVILKNDKVNGAETAMIQVGVMKLQKEKVVVGRKQGLEIWTLLETECAEHDKGLILKVKTKKE